MCVCGVCACVVCVCVCVCVCAHARAGESYRIIPNCCDDENCITVPWRKWSAIEIVLCDN